MKKKHKQLQMETTGDKIIFPLNSLIKGVIDGILILVIAIGIVIIYQNPNNVTAYFIGISSIVISLVLFAIVRGRFK